MVKSSDLSEYVKILREMEAEISQTKTPTALESDEGKAAKKHLEEILKETENYFNLRIIQCATVPYSRNPVFRAVKMRYSKCPFSWEGSLCGYGRFHLRGQETLYFAEEIEIVAHEIPAFNFANYQQIIFPANMNLTKILDVENQGHKDFLGPFYLFLNTEWGKFVDFYKTKAVTHILSTVARRHGYEAIRYESRLKGKFNVAVFPKNLMTGSKITLLDPQAGQSPTEIHCDNLNLFSF